MDKTNIVLIGMPGAGKSTIGVLLAKTMKKPFVDTDLLIQQKYNRYLQDIIDNEGIKKFILKEEDVVLKMSVRNCVVATGGSVIYSNSAIEHLKKDGLLVYLQLRFDEIDSRIGNISSRGIVIAKDQTLIDIYNERVPLYEKYAEVTINCSNKHIEDVVAEIKNTIEPILKSKK